MAVAALLAGAPAWADEAVAAFSSGTVGQLPAAPWRATRLPKVPHETRYGLVEDAGAVVLRADANASMSGLVHPLRFDPRTRPILEWRWKVSDVPARANFGTRQGDDFAARVYVLFDYDVTKLPLFARIKLRLARALYGEAVPAAGLCYVWDAKAPVGTTGWSPYTDRLRMIVVDSGTADAGRWKSVRRNVAEDFRTAFGEEPPALSGLAVATDTDNTGSSLTAWYGDLRFVVAP
ncbi:MAG: DUF3047 domain-containing protein [Burkholderiales bacterium]|nr:DUF3047 domain-containing protein [Burkholderiales bacterium]